MAEGDATRGVKSLWLHFKLLAWCAAWVKVKGSDGTSLTAHADIVETLYRQAAIISGVQKKLLLPSHKDVAIVAESATSAQDTS